MENTKIISFQPLIRPDTLKQKYPITESIKNLVMNTRQEIRNIIKGISERKLWKRRGGNFPGAWGEVLTALGARGEVSRVETGLGLARGRTQPREAPVQQGEVRE